MLTIAALLLSTTGIFVSLAREELRCRLGLSSSECLSAQPQEVSPANPQLVAAPSTNSQTTAQGTNDTQPEVKSPIPSTAKLMETVDRLRETMTPSATENTETPDSAPNAAKDGSTPTEPASASQPESPPIPMTSKENAVDAAIMGDPSPAKPEPETEPIAPPAAKNEDTSQHIPVVPAQGVAIPVTPPAQE